MMKNILIYISVLFVLVSACKGESKNTVPDGESNEYERSDEPEAVFETTTDTISAIISRQGTYMFDTPDGKVLTQLDFGTPVSYDPKLDETAKDETVYRHIKTIKGEEGYSAWYYVIENAEPYFVRTPSPLLTTWDRYAYNSKGEILYQGALVAVQKTYNGVAQISYADMDTNYAKVNRYVSTASLESIREGDLALYQAYATAYKLTNKDSQQNLLRAIQGQARGVLSREIESILYSITAEAPLPSAMKGNSLAVVSDDNLNLRSAAGTDNETVGQLSKDTVVKILDHSPAGERIGNNYDYWYEIEIVETQERGWAYGAFLKPKPEDAGGTIEDQEAPVSVG